MGLAVKLRDKPKLTEPTHADLDCHALGVSVQLPDTAAGGLFTCSTVPRPQLRGSPAGLHRAPQDVGRADPLAPARPYADEYALADFLRVSPWSGEALRTAVLRALLQTVTAIQAKTGWRLLFLSVDDSLCCKDIATRKLEAVSLHFDHVRQRRQQHQRFALCGRASATRPAAIPVDLAAVSQTQAGQSAQSAAPRAGLAAVDVSRAAQPGAADARRDRAAAAGQVQSLVLFDAWYASSELLRFIRTHGWHFICAAKANRRLDTYSLAEWWHHLGHQPTERVTLRSTKGSRTYSTRYRVGRLRRYPELLTAVFCKRNRRDTRPVYFLCSDITLSVRCILKYYRLPLASRSGQLLSQSALGPGRLSRAVLRRHRALACPGVRCLRLPAIPAGAAVVRRPQGDSAAAGRRLGRPSTLVWSPDDPGILPVWCGRA